MKRIPFTLDMIQAIRKGTKTMTRRLVKYPDGCLPVNPLELAKYEVGDKIWVPETYTILEPEHCGEFKNRFMYKADMDESAERWRKERMKEGYKYKFKSPRFATFESARIFIEIVSVRFESLQDITDDDAIREGIEICSKGWRLYGTGGGVIDSPKASFRSLWEKIYGPQSWSDNPAVFVYGFKIASK